MIAICAALIAVRPVAMDPIPIGSFFVIFLSIANLPKLMPIPATSPIMVIVRLVSGSVSVGRFSPIVKNNRDVASNVISLTAAPIRVLTLKPLKLTNSIYLVLLATYISIPRA